MSDMTNEKIIKQIIDEKRLKESTGNLYCISLILYSKLNNKSIKELLLEAEQEEEDGIRWKHRKIRQRLIDYRLYLLENYKLSTAKIYLNKVMAVYRHFEIEIHPLPSISTKGAKISPPINYTDILTKKEIQEVIKVSNPLFRALTLFMISSGCARNETLNLTIQDFIDALSEYTLHNNIYDIIYELKDKNDIIPTFHIKRQKTNKYYYTFCTPEATNYILYYLQSREEQLSNNKKLFDVSKQHVLFYYSKLNKNLKLGKAGDRNRLRSHSLRKFHASNLNRGENALTLDEIDSLQGRGKTQTRESYFMDDPRHLKKKYIANMGQLTINQEIDKLTIDSPEVLEIKKDKKRLEDENKSYKELMDSSRKKLEILEQLDLEDMENLLS